MQNSEPRLQYHYERARLQSCRVYGHTFRFQVGSLQYSTSIYKYKYILQAVELKANIVIYKQYVI